MRTNMVQKYEECQKYLKSNATSALFLDTRLLYVNFQPLTT